MRLSAFITFSLLALCVHDDAGGVDDIIEEALSKEVSTPIGTIQYYYSARETQRRHTLIITFMLRRNSLNSLKHCLLLPALHRLQATYCRFGGTCTLGLN